MVNIKVEKYTEDNKFILWDSYMVFDHDGDFVEILWRTTNPFKEEELLWEGEERIYRDSIGYYIHFEKLVKNIETEIKSGNV